MFLFSLGCGCDVGGAYNQYCDATSGQCSCRQNVTGRDCSRCIIIVLLINTLNRSILCLLTRRKRGRVVRASDLKSGGPGFKSHSDR